MFCPINFKGSLFLSRLKRLNVSSNQLVELPAALFNNNQVLVIDVSRNQITTLPNTNKQWNCSSLEKLDCSNNLLTDLPTSISGAHRLKILDLSHNKIQVFSKSWKCQLVCPEFQSVKKFDQYSRYKCRGRLNIYLPLSYLFLE